MKLILAIFGLMMVLTFGAISAVNGGTPASAGQSSPTGTNFACHDDGDDDQAPNEEPVDDPDSEDNNEEEDTDGRDDEAADPEDQDPSYEDDDDVNCDIGPTGVLADTSTPSPTPCVTFNPASQSNCCPPVFADVGAELIPPECCGLGSGAVGAQAPGICCIFYPFLIGCCDDLQSLDVGALEVCCDFFQGEDDVGAEFGFCCDSFDGENEVNSEFICFPFGGDADCDGEVTSSDAFSTLAQLGGVEAAADTCPGGGDADCSGALDALDTLAILKILAGFAEAATC